mgnify:CR=1 FL=1
MREIIGNALAIVGISILLAFGSNLVHPNKISWVGIWPDNRRIQALDKPTSFDPQTDSLITLEEAFLMWKDKSAVFIDTREPEEFAEGHIPGAINLPFERWNEFWDSAKPLIGMQDRIVTYCGGLDCELSLYAAREFQSLGYGRPLIFFGGYVRWIEQGLPIERSQR